ncbi:MAG: 3'-5' exoribonuclease YhaM family protein [Desulfonatronovibrio sp.]
MRQKKYYIQEIIAGQQIEDLFIVAQSRLDQAKNGPYWQLTLQDKTGSIQARIWSPLSQNFEKIEPEQIVSIRATAQNFRDQTQLNIDALECVDPEETDISYFLPVSETPPQEIYRNLMEFLHKNIIFPPWIRLYKSILRKEEIKTALIKAPGGKSIHHAYIGGLLEHTLGVCKICDSMSQLYPDVDKDILLVGAALHDIGKSLEISSGITRDYSDEGKLLGHIFIGMEMIQPFLNKAKNLAPELITHLKHIIISHHGELEFGSPKRHKTSEAFILHFADNLDAKINTINQAHKNSKCLTNEGSWSDFQRSMGRFLYNPPKTPKPDDIQKNKKRSKTKEEQCLSPLKE